MRPLPFALRVRTHFCEELERDLNGKSGKQVSRSQRASLQFPVGRLARFVKEGSNASCVGGVAPVHVTNVTTVLEYGVAEEVEPAGNAGRTVRRCASSRATFSWLCARARILFCDLMMRMHRFDDQSHTHAQRSVLAKYLSANE